jgi:outer membrane protein OmpA-like peptidoglycan-associated protein
MLKLKLVGIAAIFIATMWFLSASVGSQAKTGEVFEMVNPADEVYRFDSEMSNAQKNQVNILAPISFAKAEEHLNDAKEALVGGDEISELLAEIASGRAQLQRAEEMAQVARTTLPNVIKARELARVAGAISLREDYVKVEKQFLKLTKAIEKDDLRYAQNNRDKVAAAFDELEVRAIKEQTLGEARKLIKQAEEHGARKFAPNTLEVSQQKLNEADAFISEHRYEREKIQQESAEALFQAKRVLEVTEQSKRVKEMEPEEISLWVEGILSQTASTLSAPDMRNKSFDSQRENILGSVSALQEDKQFLASQNKAHIEEIEYLKQQIGLLEGKTKDEQATLERLEREKRFNQLFNEVAGYFDPDEAEVYKKSDRLLIRLKAIQFPVGKSIIMPDNYELLSKVQKAIRTFGEPDVVIEGHTDTTESAEVSEYLSEERAESVRRYLVANQTLPEEKIVAVGFGSKRPLATNETKEGRAINRRIDIVISPRPQDG